MRAYHGLDFHVLSLTYPAGSCVSSDSFRTCQTWPLLTRTLTGKVSGCGSLDWKDFPWDLVLVMMILRPLAHTLRPGQDGKEKDQEIQPARWQRKGSVMKTLKRTKKMLLSWSLCQYRHLWLWGVIRNSRIKRNKVNLYRTTLIHFGSLAIHFRFPHPNSRQHSYSVPRRSNETSARS